MIASTVASVSQSLLFDLSAGNSCPVSSFASGSQIINPAAVMATSPNDQSVSLVK